MITTNKMRSHGKSNGKTYANILDCCFSWFTSSLAQENWQYTSTSTV